MDKNQSKLTREISSVNKPAEVTENVLHRYNFSIKFYHAWRTVIGIVVGKA